MNCLTTFLNIHSLLCKLSIIRLFWIELFAEAIVVINYSIRLVHWMKWPETIVNFAHDFFGACIEIALVLVAIENVLLKESNSSLVGVRFLADVSSFESCFSIMG